MKLRIPPAVGSNWAFPFKKRRPVSELVHGICSSAVDTWLIVPRVLNPYSKSLAAATADNGQLEEQLCLNRFSAQNQLPAAWLLIFSIRVDEYIEGPHFHVQGRQLPGTGQQLQCSRCSAGVRQVVEPAS